MRSLRRLLALVCLLGLLQSASATEPPPYCSSWRAFFKQCCTGWVKPCCGCPDDYCYKPLPPVHCRFCPKGCDHYDYKPLPPVHCRFCPNGCDNYCWKPYPCVSSNCRPWYSCGAGPCGGTGAPSCTQALLGP
jgi:hypothetical protein